MSCQWKGEAIRMEFWGFEIVLIFMFMQTVKAFKYCKNLTKKY